MWLLSIMRGRETSLSFVGHVAVLNRDASVRARKQVL